MTIEQISIFAILGCTLVLFAWGRWRFDVVAMAALLSAVLTGLVPAENAFSGFGHPAVITVAAVLVITRALTLSGLIDAIARRLADLAGGRLGHLALLSALGAVLSAFMNNVGAMALLMPVALSTARKFGYSAALLLMPVSFATLLGGLTTVIGTPPNLIVASYRNEAVGAPFAMFDFAPVGFAVTLAGIAFILLIGWRLIPRHRQARMAAEDLFQVADYVTEVRITRRSTVIGRTIEEFERMAEGSLVVLSLVRAERRVIGHIRFETLREGDILLLQTDSATLAKLVDDTKIELVAKAEDIREHLAGGEVALAEAVVAPRAWIENRTPATLRLRHRYGVNLLAVARQGEPFRQRLRSVRLRAGDVLLLQGNADTLPETIASLGCLPLAGRNLTIEPRQALLPVALFATGILAVALGLVSVAIGLATVVLVLALTRLMPLREIYGSIDWPIIVLLGAMIPVGGALETTGATDVIADGLLATASMVSPHLVLALVMVVTIMLSNILNNAATAVIMAPLGVALAGPMGVSADPLLMGVAIGSSCAFLTPIGHQNNTLIMGPGGYRFGDYWRLGLPLEIVILAVSTPLIPVVWPF